MTLGVYTDNRSTTPRDVELEFEAEGLRLVDQLGVIVAFWPYDGLSVAKDESDRKQLKISHQRFLNAAFTSKDSSILKRLHQLPSGDQSSLIDGQFIIRLLIIFATGLLCYLLTIRATHFLATPISQMISPEKEQGLALGVLRLLSQNYSVCAASKGQAALDKITAKIAPAVGLPLAPKITVLDDPRIHGFALGAGQVAFFRGLLEGTKSQEEFIALTVHELAHTADRHPMAAMLRSLGLSFFARVYFENHSHFRFANRSIEDRLASLRYSKEEEIKARKLAEVYLATAGLAGLSYKDFSARAQAALGKQQSSYFARAHLMPIDNSIVNSSTEVQKSLLTSQPVLTATEWGSLKNICSDVMPLAER